MHVHMTNFTVHYYLIGWDKAGFKYINPFQNFTVSNFQNYAKSF